MTSLAIHMLQGDALRKTIFQTCQLPSDDTIWRLWPCQCGCNRHDKNCHDKICHGQLRFCLLVRIGPSFAFFTSPWCLPYIAYKSHSPKNEILSKCQFNCWQLLSDYFRLALRSNSQRPFFIGKSHLPFGTDLPCIYSVKHLNSPVSVWIYQLLVLSFISVDAGLCFCILNWTFSGNLDRVQ